MPRESFNEAYMSDGGPSFYERAKLPPEIREHRQPRWGEVDAILHDLASLRAQLALQEGELETVRHDVADIAVELDEAITGLEREWERGKIRQYNIDQLGVIVTRLCVHAPATTEGDHPDG